MNANPGTTDREPIEANFDGLVGPTHQYAGLATGNRASARNAGLRSNPREAALQGLAKMRALSDLGLAQGLFPPQERPCIAALRARGFSGDDATVLRRAQRAAPERLVAACSASSMWAANAATVSPSADCADGRVHFTVANLASHPHRALEAPETARLLTTWFAPGAHFVHHAPLEAGSDLAQADEGAANQLRLCTSHGAAGLEVFVHGRDENGDARAPTEPRARPRQTRAAGEAIARAHRLCPSRLLLLRQHPAAIAAGAFHNDVVAVSHRNLLLHHEQAYVDDRELPTMAQAVLGPEARLHCLRVDAAELTLDEAVASYLFNSQLVDVPGAGTWLLCAHECQETPRAWNLVQRWIADPDIPIDAVRVFDLRQSMRNGGGPACLRLRVVLTADQRSAVHPGAWLDAARHAELVTWVERHYRDRLEPEDLADPQLLDESRTALDRLTRILGLGNHYAFQR
ncbi:MAG: N-succinylarginine dihydrolase [Panacagrimonas sp.]|jgi:succinylarginine dihydrolase|nr:N-succinylarginine dihydrolase [Panacagrimonas sp.]MCC2655901.1 N-succinylarginine dihydrolase [Panacagrimonas sp.]